MRETPSIQELRDANPIRLAPDPPEHLFDSIVSSHDGSEPEAGGRATSKLTRRLIQAILGTMAVLLIGVGATWAATGENPIERFFNEELSLGESDYAMDSFSLLEPATQAEFEALPRMAKFMASTARMPETKEELRAVGGELGPNTYVTPGKVTAIGQGETASGTGLIMFVIDDKLCVKWDSGFGNCANPELIIERGAVGASPEWGQRDLWRVYGIAVDGVETITIDGRDEPPIEVTDNVFELRNRNAENLRLIGRDADGNEVLRTAAPLENFANMGK